MTDPETRKRGGLRLVLNKYVAAIAVVGGGAWGILHYSHEAHINGEDTTVALNTGHEKVYDIEQVNMGANEALLRVGKHCVLTVAIENPGTAVMQNATVDYSFPFTDKAGHLIANVDEFSNPKDEEKVINDINQDRASSHVKGYCPTPVQQ